MHIVIIGNGISGITTARWIRKMSDHQITVISSESEHFYSRTALMYIYMGHMRYEDTKPYEDWFWEKNRINLVYDHVNHIDFEEQRLSLDRDIPIHYDKLVLALGSKSNKFGWPGQDLNGVIGLYSLQDLDLIEKYSSKLNRAVIVGGGLIGIELAEMLYSRNIPVTMLVREASYWDMVLPKEESEMINRHIAEHHIDLRLNTNLKEIIDDGSGKVEGVITLESEERLDCGMVGLTPGVSPNIQWLKESGINTNRGIVVNNYLETNIANVYAIGDCAELSNPQPGRRNVEAIWYTGRMMGETCAYNICGERIEYNPGIWFNSAKFFDIEYQVYGEVPVDLPDNLATLYWEHSQGEKSVRINYNKNTNAVVGFNLMGIRFRHEVCEKWIKEKAQLQNVIDDLSLANFDPEFYNSIGSELRLSLSIQAGLSLSETRRRRLNDVLSFLKK